MNPNNPYLTNLPDGSVPLIRAAQQGAASASSRSNSIDGVGGGINVAPQFSLYAEDRGEGEDEADALAGGNFNELDAIAGASRKYNQGSAGATPREAPALAATPTPGSQASATDGNAGGGTAQRNARGSSVSRRNNSDEPGTDRYSYMGDSMSDKEGL